LLKTLEQAQIWIHLAVTDATGATVDGVDVRLSTANRDVHHPAGRVHRASVNSPETVTISAAGFQATTLQLTPSTFAGQSQSVVLNALVRATEGPKATGPDRDPAKRNEHQFLAEFARLLRTLRRGPVRCMGDFVRCVIS